MTMLKMYLNHADDFRVYYSEATPSQGKQTFYNNTYTTAPHVLFIHANLSLLHKGLICLCKKRGQNQCFYIPYFMTFADNIQIFQAYLLES